jgi:uncharacterized protein
MGPLKDEFRYPLFMAYLDLSELPWSFDGTWFWSARRPALARFRRSDYLGDPDVPLSDAVRELVMERTGVHVTGPIRLLTHLRYFGKSFNPVSFYYCFSGKCKAEVEGETEGKDEGKGKGEGDQVVAVVAEVTNTPWGERHSYVMGVDQPADHGTVTLMRGQFDKQLHVSPLLGMDHTYDWRLTVPAEQLLVHIDSSGPDGKSVFDATLTLNRRELTPSAMRVALLRYPFLTARILARIYTHALRLKLRGAHYFPHPKKGAVQT